MSQVIIETNIPHESTNFGQEIAESVKQLTSRAQVQQNYQNITQNITQNILDSSSLGAFLPIILGIVVVAFILYILRNRKKSGNQNIVALIGERYSGKTQLFMTVNGGKIYETVPSITNNQTSLKMPSSTKSYQFIDYCGDGISKDEILNFEKYLDVHTIIQVVDGTDSTKLGDVALFMYRLLVSKSYQKRECNYIVFLNKSDNQNFLTKAKIVRRLEDQIEHIKQSRKNSPQESEDEEDYLKGMKTRFDLSKSGIKIVSGASKAGDIKELENLLEESL